MARTVRTSLRTNADNSVPETDFAHPTRVKCVREHCAKRWLSLLNAAHSWGRISQLAFDGLVSNERWLLVLVTRLVTGAGVRLERPM